MIKLSKEQQAKEDARFAKEVLANPVFVRVFTDFEKTFTEQLLNLDPENKEAFPIVQAPRKYLRLIRNQLENLAGVKEVQQAPKVMP